MKHVGVELQFHTFLKSALDAGDGSASLPGRIFLKENI
jgi:hypothetical protein